MAKRDDAIQSRPLVAEVEWFGPSGAPPRYLIEIPHGATRTTEYHAIRALLSPTLPEDLIDFFHVNTDAGAPEYGRCVAEELPRLDSLASVLLVRCLIPRTFADTNRILAAGKTEMTGAIAEYVREERDVQTLSALHAAYREIVEAAYALVCGSGGRAFMPHTYAPRSVSIDTFDEGIGRALRAAYEPEVYATWPERPEVDVITEAPDGTRLAPHGIMERLRAGLAGVTVAENASYKLHPATLGHHFSALYPGQVLCLEVRRDLLADPFTPFAEMRIDPARASRIAAGIAGALTAA